MCWDFVLVFCLFVYFFERLRKGQPSPVISYEKNRNNKADRHQAFSLLCQRQGLGRQEDRRTDEYAMTAEHRRMENYQSSAISWAPLISQSPGTNYCGIIGSPQRPDELQALWAQRVTDQQARARSPRLAESQKPAVPLALKCCMKAAKQTSSTAEPLFPSCRLSTVVLSQARHPPSRPLGGGGAVQWRGVCEPASAHACFLFVFFFPLSLASAVVRHTLHTSNKCAQACCSHTCPCNSLVNRELQCSRQHLLHGDASHKKHVPSHPHSLITLSYSGTGLQVPVPDLLHII